MPPENHAHMATLPSFRNSKTTSVPSHLYHHCRRVPFTVARPPLPVLSPSCSPRLFRLKSTCLLRSSRKAMRPNTQQQGFKHKDIVFSSTSRAVIYCAPYSPFVLLTSATPHLRRQLLIAECELVRYPLSGVRNRGVTREETDGTVPASWKRLCTAILWARQSPLQWLWTCFQL